MTTVDASTLGTAKKGLEKATAPPPTTPTADKAGHGTGRQP